MKRSLSIGVAILICIGGAETLEAGFGDAVVGGVVGGVVGSVITNEIYHSGRRHHTTQRTHRKKRRTVRTETEEMKIQRSLKSLGFYRGPIDGQINSFETRTAIKEFNRAYEIGDTAYMSPQERDSLVYLGNLLQIDRSLILQGTDRRSKTKRIQAALKVLGFYTGKIDGSSGPMTRRAISEYRQANGLPPGYRLGYEDEYRLITTAKQSNDRNIEETLASLKRLGAGMHPIQPRQPVTPAAVQPMILQPARTAPVQPTITQTAPAPVPVQSSVPQPVQSGAVPLSPAPVPPAPAPVTPQSDEPVILQPAN